MSSLGVFVWENRNFAVKQIFFVNRMDIFIDDKSIFQKLILLLWKFSIDYKDNVIAEQHQKGQGKKHRKMVCF